MTPALGNGVLIAAALCGAAGLFASAEALLGRGQHWAARARSTLYASGVLTAVGASLLALACLRCDFQNAYVAAHTELSLSPILRFAASWSGQEGSLLLWAMFIAGVGALTARKRRHIVHRGEPVTLAAFPALNLFFAALLLLAANPFVQLPVAPCDGRGLHPELQHWAMILHPPIVFLGYSLFAAPMAITAGALVGRRSDNQWVAQIRRWALVAWLSLGAGIALGGYWAYVELGWGGYWVWDAVENASLIPWLTGAGLVHAIIVHQHRGLMKGWTASLALGTFILCIFGAFITRSGAVSSVHAFARSGVGFSFGGLAIVLLLGAASLLVWRRRVLRPTGAIESAAGREAATLLGNILLVTMAVLTLAGTCVPLVSRLWTASPLAAGRSFYDHAVAPLGLAVAALLALAPLLCYGRAAASMLRQRALVPSLAAVLAVGAAFAVGLHHPVSLICTAVTAFACAAMLIDWLGAAITQARHTGFGLLETAARILDNNHRRYGGQAAHLGFLILLLGIVGSSMFSASTTATVQAGQTISVGRYTLRFDGVRQARGVNYTAAQASLTLLPTSSAPRTLVPQQLLFERSSHPSARVAILSSWSDDLYVALIDWSHGGAAATIQARLNPLTVWIWIGAAVLTLASIYCVLPRLIPPPRDLPVPPPRDRSVRAVPAEPAGWGGEP